MRILLVNDDGIHAPGLQAMRVALQPWGDVDVVAPLVEQSGVGHAITYRRPLQVHRWDVGGSFYGWQVDGTPADCVKLGVTTLCETKPDLIVSGVNSGANVGLNVFYSGTAAGCVEGAMFGIPSFATSVYLMKGITPDYRKISETFVKTIETLRERVPAQLAWNLNYPATAAEPQKTVFTPMQFRRAEEQVDARVGPRGNPYYWIGIHPMKSHPSDPGYDVGDLANECLTITPLSLDLTCHEALAQLNGDALNGGAMFQ